MSFDLAAAERRIRPQRSAPAPRRRPDAALPFIAEAPGAGPPLMLDTCVYIDVLQGRSPPALDALLSLRILNHSSICLAELTHLFGRLDPRRAETKAALRRLTAAVRGIPDRRLSAPTPRAFGEAGMLAGLMMRLTGRAADARPALLSDAVLYLHARERGSVVLTRNVHDFDGFDQLLPGGRVLFYRRQ